MPDTLTRTLELIRKSLFDWSKTGKSGEITFKINMSQGGVGDSEVEITERVRLKEVER
jgi:hypothetical protein